MKSLYFSAKLYVGLLIIALLFGVSILWTPLFYIVALCATVLVAFVGYEYYYLRRITDDFAVTRNVDAILSLSDINEINYEIQNNSPSNVYAEFIDEFPFQLQIRDFRVGEVIASEDSHKFFYAIVPKTRGEYEFGRSYLFLSHPKIKLIKYRLIFDQSCTTKVYPSIVQMKKAAIKVFSKTASMMGVRKIRRRGENDEFEQLKKYVQGDNIKAINWKATSRIGKLVVNQFQDSRSQNVYCIIDKGRNMEMPFEGLSLLDHSINAVLALSNIVLRKYDKVGLITFDDKTHTFLKADNKKLQLERVTKYLYKEQTSFSESGFEHLYIKLRHELNNRSILFLFTNFESITDYYRHKDFLGLIAKRHLLVVIIFENSELINYTKETYQTKDGIYKDIIATSLVYEKEKIIKEMRHHGIQTILTEYKDLSMEVINKYLDIKSTRLN